MQRIVVSLLPARNRARVGALLRQIDRRAVRAEANRIVKTADARRDAREILGLIKLADVVSDQTSEATK